LPTPGGPEHDDVVAVLDEVAAGQLLHLLAVDRGLVVEVEGLQRLDEREARHRRAHGDVLARLGGHLLAEHLLEELGVGKIVGRRVLQQRLKPLAALEQPQLAQVPAQALELRGRGHGRRGAGGRRHLGRALAHAVASTGSAPNRRS
jgi:hypothetical protein